MESELQKKRNIFRSSLRRQFIQSFQRSIRMKYLQRQRQQRYEKIKNENKHNFDEIVSNLDQILKMTAQDICTQDNFQYFIQVIQGVVNKKTNIQANHQSKNNQFRQFNDQRCFNNEHSRNRINFTQYQRNFSHFPPLVTNFNQTKNIKIGSGWVNKQRIYSLLYRILQKSFGDTKGKLWYVINQVLYLLEFPQLMPLWEKLSSISDLRSKNYCSNQFSKKLTKNSFMNTFPTHSNTFNSILDPQFVLDILTNFIVQNPCIQFQNSLQLMPFINYALNINMIGSIQSDKQNLIYSREQSYPKLNKVCIILRSILKQDSMKRLAKLVQNGCQDIFLFLFEEISKLFCPKQKKQFRRFSDEMDEEKSNQSSTISNKLECGFLQTYKTQNSLIHKKPANLLITTKTNLIKLLNRLFVANPHIATFLYLKTQNIRLYYSLFSSISMNGCNSEENFAHSLSFFNSYSSSSQSQQIGFNGQQKYKFIILCDSHRILLKNILSTVNVMLIAGSSSGHSFIDDFMNSSGLSFLEMPLFFENIDHFSKQMINIIQTIDAQGSPFYSKLISQDLKRFINIILQIFINLASKYNESLEQLSNLKQKQFGLMSETISFGFIQWRWCMCRILKVFRNSILIAYARATQPCVFQEVVDNIIYSSECKIYLQNLSLYEKKNCSQDQQIKFYSGHILQICQDPKSYLQRQKNYSLNRE